MLINHKDLLTRKKKKKEKKSLVVVDARSGIKKKI
jgi:hypothetical protein